MEKGKFEIFKDKGGQYRFHLKAGNGQVLCSSEGYSNKQKAREGADSVRRLAHTAEQVEKD
jgi:uncharacterized protein YegP (UPF0339 family)